MFRIVAISVGRRPFLEKWLMLNVCKTIQKLATFSICFF